MTKRFKQVTLMCDVTSAKSCLQVVFWDVSELSQFRKKRRRGLRLYPPYPPPAANYTPVVKVCQLVLCYKIITDFYCAISAEKEACRREPACRPVSRFGGKREKVPRPAAAAIVKPLCGTFRAHKVI
jgi:hypothetical protein